MFVIAGLGNPGAQYQHTRHNVGFDTVDILSQKWGMVLNRNKHKALIGEGTFKGEKVLLVKPQTYMNASGESLLDLVGWYKLPPSNLIVVYDDIDLDPGVLRIRAKGGAGTHNGMRSILYQLQSEDFPRVRIGIGSPPPQWDLANYVLSRFSKEEQELIFKTLTRASEAIEWMISSGVQEAMSRFNGG